MGQKESVSIKIDDMMKRDRGCRDGGHGGGGEEAGEAPAGPVGGGRGLSCRLALRPWASHLTSLCFCFI